MIVWPMARERLRILACSDGTCTLHMSVSAAATSRSYTTGRPLWFIHDAGPSGCLRPIRTLLRPATYGQVPQRRPRIVFMAVSTKAASQPASQADQHLDSLLKQEKWGLACSKAASKPERQV